MHRRRPSSTAARQRPMPWWLPLLGIAAAVPAGAIEALGPAAGTLEDVVVTAPLPGADLLLSEVPANVQRLGPERLRDGGASDVASALSQFAGSVHLNDTQGNPFQPDVLFRGFTGSPVLGTPQGISVFVDGVRVNETFADAVNWALIPGGAISAIEVSPGSNPVFGLNTLGGAIIITTRRGFDDAGADVGLEGGSFGRRKATLSGGGHGERVDYFLAADAYDDDGWTEHNPSRLRQGYGKLGYRDATHDVSWSLTSARSNLEGNQTLPQSWLSTPRDAYSWPDVQADSLIASSLSGSHRLARAWTLSETLFYRKVRTDVVNSNVNEEFDTGLAIGPGNEPTGNVFEQIDQVRQGIALQLVGRDDLAGRRNTFILGVAGDAGRTEFHQSLQEAGATRDTVSGAQIVLDTALDARSESRGLYASDTLALGARSSLNLAGRYNDARVTLEDRLGTRLNGHHRFSRFSPSIGATYRPRERTTVYVRYEESMRTPTPVELTCADPAAPCSLPNAFAADPPLKAVVARTAEVGARGGDAGGLAWTAALFRTDLDDDIEFISSGSVANAGYFQNVGRTRREGVEVGIEARRGHLGLSGHYSLIDATFRTPLVLASPYNSTARGIRCDGCLEIAVQPGDRIPGIPRQLLKGRAEYEIGRWRFGVTVLAQSGQFARGDENNRDVNGPLSGSVRVHLDARFEFAPRWAAYARVDNLFDRSDASFATLGRNVFTEADRSFDATGTSWRAEQFRSVGAPRGVWMGIAYRVGPVAER